MILQSVLFSTSLLTLIYGSPAPSSDSSDPESQVIGDVEFFLPFGVAVHEELAVPLETEVRVSPVNQVLENEISGNEDKSESSYYQASSLKTEHSERREEEESFQKSDDGRDLLETVITDQEAISQEIERIDEAIADIDTAISNDHSKRETEENRETKRFGEAELAISTEEIDEQPIPNKETEEPITDKETEEPIQETETFGQPTRDEQDEQPITDGETANEQPIAIEETEEQPTEDDFSVQPIATETEETEDEEGKTEILVRSAEENAQLLDNFKTEESEYRKHPTEPQDTRRMFEGTASDLQFKISSMSRFDHFIKQNHMGGSVTDKEGVCSKKPTCDFKRKYRSFDGTCNNIDNPQLGSTYTPYRRLISPAYGDGISLPRGVEKWEEGAGYTSTLPSPRKISEVAMAQENETLTESTRNTHMLMQFGQFLAHDMLETAGQPVDCCQQDIRNLGRCFPINVSESDSFYSVFGKKCLDFTRSDTHCNRDLKFSEQMNKQTAFVDGSAIYGSSEEHANKIRGEKKGGTLSANSVLSKFLPSKFDLKIHKGLDRPTDFVAGDDRAETQASLTAMHNMWLNEHNRIAEFMFKELRERSKMSNEDLDELVYQETRRLVVAQMQKIAFQEFLPEVIGLSAMSENKIDDPHCVYDPQVDPTATNSFSTAAFRFGHSLVQSIFRGDTQPWRLGKFYADSRFARGDGGTAYKNELVGLSTQPCQKADLHITKQMTERLFCNNETAPGGGHDIASINIQRGRDHGIPSYNTFRKFCGLKEAESLDVVPTGVRPEAWNKLALVYTSVDEIDLWVGGLAEETTDGIVGPTFACIIGKQFKTLMDGDRFFYHHTGGPDIFPLEGAALAAMSKRTMACIICDVTGTEKMPHNAFIQENEGNAHISCADHPKMDLAKIVAEIKI